MFTNSLLLAVLLFPALAQASGGFSPAGRDATPASAAPDARKTITVDCSNPRARVRSIADGLRLLGDVRPAVLLVSGTCLENVAIQGVDRVTIQGNPTATIDGGSDPSVGTVELLDAASIDLVDLTITGGGEGVGCSQCLARLTRVTIQGTLGLGVSAGARSHLVLFDSFVRNNPDLGVFVGNASTVNLVNTSVSGNGSHGALLNVGATLLVFSSSIAGNVGSGVSSSLHGSVLLNTTAVTGNGGDGVSIQGGSALHAFASTLSGNGGHQARIGDLSFARFAGAANTVAGSTFPDLVCDGSFSVLRGIARLPTATTNCPTEQPPVP
jgi:hypothetical protein